MAIITEYSLWFVLVCLLVGAVYAFILYYKNKRFQLEKRPSILMASLRGLAMAMICFLLLTPMLKLTTKNVAKPVILFAIDRSESVAAGKDSLFYKNELPKQIEKLRSSFGRQYEVETYFIGEQNVPQESEENLSIQYQDKETNLSSIFDELAMVYANRNLGAMVLMTDGIYNNGENPYYKAQKVSFPIYAVGLGNPDLQTDFLIAGIQHNSQTFKGNLAPVEIKVKATKLAGKKGRLTVMDQKENVLLDRAVAVSGNNFFETVKLTLEAKEKGIHRYKVILSELEGEVTYKNNVADFFMEVVDSREKIAIVYDAPHPDVSALKQAMELSEKYQVDVFSADEFKSAPADYSLIVLHQLPSATHPVNNLLTQAQKTGTSLLYVVGKQTNLNALNGLHPGMTIVQNKNLFNEAGAVYNDNFTSFNFSEEAKEMMKNYPPLQTIFGEYRTTVSANTFVFQKIGTVKTSDPLIAFSESHGQKVGIVAGTGIWQWKLYNYLYSQNHDAFNELVNQITLYLSVKNDKSFFRVSAKNLYNENESVVITAELYNDSYELVTEPDVEFTLVSEDKKQYNAIFSKQNNAYELDMGELPIGQYEWTATTTYGGKRYKKSGTFTVREIVVETQNLVADHDLLKSMANATDGKFFLPQDMQQIRKEIENNENITSIASYSKNYNLLLHSWIYFAVLMLLLAMEWFLRKWNGGY